MSMDVPYGFIEESMAQYLGLDYIPYNLSGGSKAAMIDAPTFNVVYGCIRQIHDETRQIPEITPRIFNSDVVGMRIILHKYYVDDGVFDSLTGGDVKGHSLYGAIKNFGESTTRFDETWFKATMLTKFANQAGNVVDDDPFGLNAPAEDPLPFPEPAQVQESVPEVVKEPDPIPEVKVDTPEEILKKKMSALVSEISSYLVDYQGMEKFGEGNSICFMKNLRGVPSRISDLAKMIGRMIIFSTHYNTCVNAERTIRSACSKIGLKPEDHVLVICGSMNDVMGFVIPMADAHVRSTCLGHQTKYLFIPHSSDDQHRTPYRDYDYVYKDTVTNVVFALRKGMMVSILCTDYDNPSYTTNLFYEIGRRIDGKVSYDELRGIDKAYWNQRFAHEESNYVEFAVGNSKSLITNLENQLEEIKTRYQESFDKAMILGKTMQQLSTQIACFDKEKLESEERAKALKNYQDTVALKKVSSIAISDGVIHVYTKNIYAQDDRTKKWHDIGTFHIRIRMHDSAYSTDGTVRIKNTKYQIRSFSSYMEAPHIFKEGNICHGNLSTGMINAYQRKDLFQLVYQLIVFLGSANTDDSAGKYINCWPEVSEEVAMQSDDDMQTEDEKKMQEFKAAEKEFDDSLLNSLPIKI